MTSYRLFDCKSWFYDLTALGILGGGWGKLPYGQLFFFGGLFVFLYSLLTCTFSGFWKLLQLPQLMFPWLKHSSVTGKAAALVCQPTDRDHQWFNGCSLCFDLFPSNTSPNSHCDLWPTVSQYIRAFASCQMLHDVTNARPDGGSDMPN